MDNTAKELAKYIRKGNNANEDVILRAPAAIDNPLYIENMPPYTKNVEPENALIFKNENESHDISFTVKYANIASMESTPYKLLFSYDGVNWGDIPVCNDGISFKLKTGDKVMFRANTNSNTAEFDLLRFENTTSGATGYVTVTGKISALVNKDDSIQVTSLLTDIPSVFNDFCFRNFEINSTKNIRIDAVLLGLFKNCIFKTMSFDCDNYLFDTFYTKHNTFADTRHVVIFIKTRENLTKLFNLLTIAFSSITDIVKIYDTEEPNMLYYDNSTSIHGILDRNIGAKSIFDCGYFFELANNPIKPWTIDEIYNTRSFPFDGEYYISKYKDYSDIIKHFCGPHYTFFSDELFPYLTKYTTVYGFNDYFFGYPIMVLHSMPTETANNASIHTGILLTTFIINNSALINLPYSLFYAPDTENNIYSSYYFSYIDMHQTPIDNMYFRTLRPCVIPKEVTSIGTSAYIYENAEKILPQCSA